MSATLIQNSLDVPPAFFHQWQWEEALNGLRNLGRPETLKAHWPTTGHRQIDARARATIAEWAVLDGPDACDLRQGSPCIFDNLVRQALADQVWDLYTVESIDGAAMNVRGLRNPRGLRVDWIEGREPPAKDEIVALRLIHLNPPGVHACTLPLRFGQGDVSKRLIPALLRAFGSSTTEGWTDFMGNMGARILLEYALAALEREAQARPSVVETSDTELDAAFALLEARLSDPQDLSADSVLLGDGRLAWLEDFTGSVHLRIFDDAFAWRSFLEAVHPTVVPWLRARRLGDEGPVYLERRDRFGRFQDASKADRRCVIEACRRLSDRHISRAA